MARVWTIASTLVLSGATALPAAEPSRYVVDSAASRVRVHLGRAGLLKFLGHDHEIDAPLAGGRVEVVEADPARSSVRLEFDARRLAVVSGTEPAGDIAKVEERMRGPEVLDAGRQPAIAFASTAVSGEQTEPGRFRLRVRGTLELKGRSLPVEVPLEVRVSSDSLRATGEVRLRLRALGIEPPSVAAVVNVSNDVRVTFDVMARGSGGGGAPFATEPPRAGRRDPLPAPAARRSSPP